MDEIIATLKTIRAPIQQGEYDLHQIVMDTLAARGIPFVHEAKLGPRCRIDLLCGGVGLEIKRGKPDRKKLISQLTRYAGCDGITALVAVCEGSVALPRTLCGKPVAAICLNKLWGIAL
ncbi:MAG: hypothetical protein Q4C54_02495 [Clostridia bacterium]|nr:hypothetical protein [Clostridia bacterium]